MLAFLVVAQLAAADSLYPSAAVRALVEQISQSSRQSNDAMTANLVDATKAMLAALG